MITPDEAFIKTSEQLQHLARIEKSITDRLQDRFDGRNPVVWNEEPLPQWMVDKIVEDFTDSDWKVKFTSYTDDLGDFNYTYLTFWPVKKERQGFWAMIKGLFWPFLGK